MDPEIRQLKQQQLEQWHATKLRLQIQEAAQGQTPDIKLVNELANAEKQIDLINRELDNELDLDERENYISLLNMVISQAKQIDILSRKVAKLTRQQNPTLQEQTARFIAISVWILTAAAFTVPSIRAFLLENPWYFLVLPTAFVLGIVIMWLPSEKSKPENWK